LTGGLKPAQSGYQPGQLDGAHARERDRRPESPQPDYIQAAHAAHGKRAYSDYPPIRRTIYDQAYRRNSPRDGRRRFVRGPEKVLKLSCAHIWPCGD
jgi:hypothetical protein